MTRWFPLMIVLPIATGANAAPFSDGLTTSDPPPARVQRLNLRIVDDTSDPRPRPVRQSGMIAQTEVLPNASIGFGILKVSKGKVGSTDWRLDGKTTGSRRPAVSFQFRF